MGAYEAERKPRAATVQGMADLVASVGQVRGSLARGRDAAMKAASAVAPSLVAATFERAVTLSLGGNAGARSWRVPTFAAHVGDRCPPPPTRSSSLAAVLMGGDKPGGAPHPIEQVSPIHQVRELGLRGSGTASVFWGDSAIARALVRLLRLPKETLDGPFEAAVEVVAPARGPNDARRHWAVSGWSFPHVTRWTRKFGASPAYSTFMSNSMAATWERRVCGSVGGVDDGCRCVLIWMGRLKSFTFQCFLRRSLV